MDPARIIRTVATQNEAYMNAYESYISQGMHESDDADELESQYRSSINGVKDVFEQGTVKIANVVQSLRPYPSEANYWKKRQYHEKLVEYACAHINHMETTFDRAFCRLNNLFRRLSIWFRNTATEVYTAVKSFFRGIINRIRA